jgi:proline dehydrogenase
MTAMNATQLGRAAIVRTAGSPLAERFVRRYGMRLGASRFVTGERLDDCIDVIKELNGHGLRANAAVLGESVTNPPTALGAVADYELLIERLSTEELDANVALKLTLLGLSFDAQLAELNLARLLGSAGRQGIFVRIDMEECRYVSPTLAIYRSLRKQGFDNVGVVLQSYLYRSPADLESLLELCPNIRVVKGAYLEAANVAYLNKRDVDRNYIRLMERALTAAGYTGIATHDERIIEHAIAFVDREGIPRERFEFQMLFGVRPHLQAALAARGYQVLVATTFGTQWYRFFIRRLAERPANLLFLLGNLAKR